MLYYMSNREYSQEEAEKITGRKLTTFVDTLFKYYSEYGKEFAGEDPMYKVFVSEIDDGDLLTPDIIKDRYSKRTYSTERSSSGVHILWLMKTHNKELLFRTSRFGDNCLPHIFKLSKEYDIYLYDDSQLFVRGYTDAYDNKDQFHLQHGKFTDYKTGDIHEAYGFGLGFDRWGAGYGRRRW